MGGSSSFYVLRVTQDHVQFATRLAAVGGFERALQGTAKRRVQQCCSSAVRSTRETLWSLDS